LGGKKKKITLPGGNFLLTTSRDRDFLLERSQGWAQAPGCGRARSSPRQRGSPQVTGQGRRGVRAGRKHQAGYWPGAYWLEMSCVFSWVF